MVYLVAFILLSIPVITISWKSLKNSKSHGFYRFFSFESILLLLVFKIEFWFTNPFSIHQLISWILLIISLLLVFYGTTTLKKYGKQKSGRKQEDLLTFEKTSELVKTGIYKYIRHPMYSSLLFLTWGIYLKNPDFIFLFAALFSSLFLVFTAIADEKECMEYFGIEYNEYLRQTKRFIPFIF
jgi:protein-S-isoprenylcysteine O-methyltransferase Ste14